MGIVRTVLVWLLSLATSVAVAYTLFGLGFVACTTPQATAAIGGTFSGWENSVFPEKDMAAIAEAARAYSIDGASGEGLFAAIQSALSETNPSLASAFESWREGAGAAFADSGDGTGGTAASALSNAAGAVSERYALSESALSHLRDCTPIFTTGRISVGVVGGFAVAGLIALAIVASRKRAGKTLMAGAGLVFALLFALGAWAVVDFNGLFTWMHQMLFAQGNWTFSSSSLLIQLFPEAFWAAMAALWVIASLVCAAIALVLGKLISHLP